ncbi:unnamed protein product [Paramecium pentaurelia]|uniref:Uncharacterized protein n=1 Tax=Paramecium pentaurelia TaxID=43138 RepID=A0A8S1WYI2_9CILI|nr:unnamed protein product [Paramecium pentaurelia]
MTDTNQSQNSQQEIQQSNMLIENAVKIRWNIWCGSRQFVKISIKIRNNNNEELIYIKNDKILRQEKILDQKNNIDLMKNVEQINHLTWRGLFSNFNNKIGIWTAYWKLQKINVGGYYDQKSQKQGKWIEIFENYCDFADATYIGQYKNGLKFGIWETIYKNKIIGLGLYDTQGSKNGAWIDLHDNFYDECQVTYYGNYKNGVKQGSWVTKHKGYYGKEYHKIGGGLYNEKGMKIGIWNEINEIFNDNSQVTFIGVYNNGKKQQRWITNFYDCEVGGGYYDSNGQKINKWIVLHENFGGGCEVIYKGFYKFGIKFGIWEILHRQDVDNQFQVIGYQMFNEYGVKNGYQTELHETFLNDYQIIYVGSYNDGIKSGQWEIKYRESNTEEFIKIGEGQYDEKGLKKGIWIDIDDDFHNYNKQMTIGLYISGEKSGQFITKELE